MNTESVNLAPEKNRLLFIDMMRGLAVIWMIEAHITNAVMMHNLKNNLIWELISISNGFVAVTFLFCAGAGFWLAASRRFTEYKTYKIALYNHVKKIALILFLGYWLHLPIGALKKFLVMPHSDWVRFFESDILQNIGVSSIIAIILLLILPKLKHLSYTSIILTIVIFFLSPIIWSLNLHENMHPFFGAYLAIPPISKFPLFHWSGYFFAGIFFSHFFMNYQNKDYLAKLLIVISLSLMFILLITNNIQPIYGWNIWWDCHPGHNIFRLSGAVFLFAMLFMIEKSIPVKVSKLISIAGQESLFIYVFHLLVVYGSVVNKGLNTYFPQNQNTLQTTMLFLIVTAVSFLMAFIWHKFKSKYSFYSRIIFHLLLWGFIIKFVIRPY